MFENIASHPNSRMLRIWFQIILLVFGTFFFFGLNISFGTVWVPFYEILSLLGGAENVNRSWEIIIVNYRLPQALTAFFAGGGLAFAGLLMQTLFRNPLAGPSVLGISSGSSLGVAILVLLFGGTIGSFGLAYNIAVSFAALAGASIVLVAILALSRLIKSNVSLLIAGIMIGYLTSSVVGILNVFSEAQNIKSFMLWGLGSFSEVGWDNIPLFISFVLIGLISGLFISKPLNAILLGEHYAFYLGVNLETYRIIIILISGFLTAIVTAWCGPIAFIGLASPHLARAIFKTSDHKVLLPGVFLIGGLICLVCNLIARLPGSDSVLPINTITSAFGAPIVIWYIARNNIRM